MNSLPIGIFDSGVGGLTVMREFIELLPGEDLIYFGDTARLPYGNKSPSAIIRFSQEIGQFLLDQKIKLLIVACHTASAHALEVLQNTLPIPVLGVREPGLLALQRATRSKRVAILGTVSTISSFHSLDAHLIACPLFVPLVEEGFQDHLAAQLIAEEYLAPLKGSKVDTVLLACTHYPLLSKVIQQVLGPEVQLIEPARYTALAALDLLQRDKLLNRQEGSPVYRFYVSDDPEKFGRLAKNFFSLSVEKVSLV